MIMMMIIVYHYYEYCYLCYYLCNYHDYYDDCYHGLPPRVPRSNFHSGHQSDKKLGGSASTAQNLDIGVRPEPAPNC